MRRVRVAPKMGGGWVEIRARMVLTRSRCVERLEWHAVLIQRAWRRGRAENRDDADPITLEPVREIPLARLWVADPDVDGRVRAYDGAMWLHWLCRPGVRHPLAGVAVPERLLDECRRAVRMCVRHTADRASAAALARSIAGRTSRDIRSAWYRSLYRQNPRSPFSSQQHVNTMLLALGLCFAQFSRAFDE